MNVKETFLRLTSHTYPHGTEHGLFDYLPQNLDMDEFGNLYIQIGESDVMFTSHLDTATGANTPVNHVIDGNIIKTDGKSILGADDKAGVTIMLYMIEKNIPGLYYFFLGEEVGCIGSRKVSAKHKVEKLPNIKKVISFDRRDTNSVITFQSSSRCCSDTFGLALSQELNRVESSFKYEKDPTGIYTDSAQFVKIYPECTNISVGYYSEHTSNERQDIDHLTKLAEACTKVNWNSLPVERDPSVEEYDAWSGYGYGYSSRSSRYSTTDDWYVPSKVSKPREEKNYFHDVKYNFVSYYVLDSLRNYSKVDISTERLNDERKLLKSFLDDIEVKYNTMLWDGVKMTLLFNQNRKTETNRQDLIEYLSDLDLDKVAKLSVEESRKADAEIYNEYCGDL